MICVYSYALCNHDVILYYMHACVQKSSEQFLVSSCKKYSCWCPYESTQNGD